MAGRGAEPGRRLRYTSRVTQRRAMPASRPRPIVGGGDHPSLAAALLVAALMAAPAAAATAAAQAASPNVTPAAPGIHNLLTNPNFDTGIGGWQASGNVTWTNALDSEGQNPASGAAVMQDAVGNTSEIYQCVDLPSFWRSVDLEIEWH